MSVNHSSSFLTEKSPSLSNFHTKLKHITLPVSLVISAQLSGCSLESNSEKEISKTPIDIA